jgi:hypothetical protein
MRLAIGDGYTLPFETESKLIDPLTKQVGLDNLPVVKGRYRPALPEAIADWRMAFDRAASGKEQVAAAAQHLAAHLVEWDATLADKAAPISAAVIARVPEPILGQLVRIVNTWAAEQKAADEGNSPTG